MTVVTFTVRCVTSTFDILLCCCCCTVTDGGWSGVWFPGACGGDVSNFCKSFSLMQEKVLDSLEVRTVLNINVKTTTTSAGPRTR